MPLGMPGLADAQRPQAPSHPTPPPRQDRRAIESPPQRVFRAQVRTFDTGREPKSPPPTRVHTSADVLSVKTFDHRDHPQWRRPHHSHRRDRQGLRDVKLQSLRLDAAEELPRDEETPFAAVFEANTIRYAVLNGQHRLIINKLDLLLSAQEEFRISYLREFNEEMDQEVLEGKNRRLFKLLTTFQHVDFNEMEAQVEDEKEELCHQWDPTNTEAKALLREIEDRKEEYYSQGHHLPRKLSQELYTQRTELERYLREDDALEKEYQRKFNSVLSTELDHMRNCYYTIGNELRRRELQKQKENLEIQTHQLEQREQAFREQVAALAARELALNERSVALDAREAHVARREEEQSGYQFVEGTAAEAAAIHLGDEESGNGEGVLV